MSDIILDNRFRRTTRAAFATAIACAMVVTVIRDEGVTRDWLSAPLVDEVGNPVTELMAASTSTSNLDWDDDGLPDAQEFVLQTSPYTVDSDGDGFGDGEEMARQSDPLDITSLPTGGGISASMTARGEDDHLRLVICIHEPAGEIDQVKLRIGALTPQGVISVPLGRFIGLATITTALGSQSSRITTIDLPVHQQFIQVNQSVTFFLAAGNQLDVSFGSAAKVDVESDQGVLVLKRPHSVKQSASLQGGPGGSIRQPIPQSGRPIIPPTWIAGAVCYQRSAVVGSSGPVVLRQVVEADCLQGWDSYCASDCGSSVGSTFETIDPAVLIGG